MTKTELISPSGGSATIYHQGAHLSSWIPSDALGEQIFVADESIYAQGTAIRGGVPVCFPQFGAFGQGVRHGFARSSDWQLMLIDKAKGIAKFELLDNAHSRSLWPHTFKLNLTVSLDSNTLSMQLDVHNTGTDPFEFSGALHTYFAVSEYTQVDILGLSNTEYWDNGTDLSDRKLSDHHALQLKGALDRVYFGASDALVLRDQGIEKRISKTGFTDVVVWNPGKEGAESLKDMGNDEYRTMLCIEAAIVDKPVTVLAGDSWEGSQTIHIFTPQNKALFNNKALAT